MYITGSCPVKEVTVLEVTGCSLVATILFGLIFVLFTLVFAGPQIGRGLNTMRKSLMRVVPAVPLHIAFAAAAGVLMIAVVQHTPRLHIVPCGSQQQVAATAPVQVACNCLLR